MNDGMQRPIDDGALDELGHDERRFVGELMQAADRVDRHLTDEEIDQALGL